MQLMRSKASALSELRHRRDARERGDPAHVDFRIADWPFYLVAQAEGQYAMCMDQALRKMNLDLASWRALMLLHEQNPSSVSEIADRAVMRLSTMTRVVQRLEKRGMARLQRRASDARVTEVFITGAGESAVTEIRNLASSIYAVAFRNVSATEIATLNRILGKICANLQLVRPAR